MAKRIRRTEKGGYYQGMPSKKYWEQRSKENLAEVFKKESEVETVLINHYKNCLISFIEEYREFAASHLREDGSLDVASLQKALRTDPKFSAKSKRLVNLIHYMAIALGKTTTAAITDSLSDTYKKTAHLIFSTFGKSTDGLQVFNKRAVETAIRTPFTADGREFSDRIWDNLNLMESKLRKTLAESITKGQSIDKTVSQFKDIFGNTTYNTQRIIRTETIACYTKSSIESYKELGLEKIMVLSEGDSCDDCAPANEEVLETKEAKVGINVPPFHPNCRCCVAPFVEW